MSQRGVDCKTDIGQNKQKNFRDKEENKKAFGSTTQADRLKKKIILMMWQFNVFYFPHSHFSLLRAYVDPEATCFSLSSTNEEDILIQSKFLLFFYSEKRFASIALFLADEKIERFFPEKDYCRHTFSRACVSFYMHFFLSTFVCSYLSTSLSNCIHIYL